MRKNEGVDFDNWFSVLCVNVLEQTGVEFRDEDSVKDDYEQNNDVYEVIDSIVAEYQ